MPGPFCRSLGLYSGLYYLMWSSFGCIDSGQCVEPLPLTSSRDTIEDEGLSALFRYPDQTTSEKMKIQLYREQSSSQGVSYFLSNSHRWTSDLLDEEEEEEETKDVVPINIQTTPDSVGQLLQVWKYRSQKSLLFQQMLLFGDGYALYRVHVGHSNPRFEVMSGPTHEVLVTEVEPTGSRSRSSGTQGLYSIERNVHTSELLLVSYDPPPGSSDLSNFRHVVREIQPSLDPGFRPHISTSMILASGQYSMIVFGELTKDDDEEPQTYVCRQLIRTKDTRRRRIPWRQRRTGTREEAKVSFTLETCGAWKDVSHPLFLDGLYTIGPNELLCIAHTKERQVRMYSYNIVTQVLDILNHESEGTATSSYHGIFRPEVLTSYEYEGQIHISIVNQVTHHEVLYLFHIQTRTWTRHTRMLTTQSSMTLIGEIDI